jgi:hypothetical protein
VERMKTNNGTNVHTSSSKLIKLAISGSGVYSRGNLTSFSYRMRNKESSNFPDIFIKNSK